MKNPFHNPLKLKNKIQHYNWGSHNAIQELLGNPPTKEPWAELWLGAHPKASSQVYFMGEWVALESLIDQYPTEILGKYTSEKFKNTLPYLFKVLAAEKPLSIQAHPSLTDAMQGFEKENRLKIPLNDPIRNYKDDRYKPECICALTPFTVLKGFRNPASIAMTMDVLCAESLSDEIKVLKSQDTHNLKKFLRSLLTLAKEKKRLAISEAVANAQKHLNQNDAYAWIAKLHQQYPDDIGIFAPAMLNLIKLKPGQALFLPSAELHSYLGGVGIELMANSDNVVRGGLTTKHVDVDELLHILVFKESGVQILLPETVGNGEAQFPLSVEEFSLSLIAVSAEVKYIAPEARGVEIILCISGSANIIFGTDKEELMIDKGSSVLIPASLKSYEIVGDAVFYKAGVPVG